MTQETETPNSPPRLLLMHGAGLGSWIWERVLPELTSPAAAVDLPGRGSGDSPDNVTLKQCIDFIAQQAGPRSILVGHSFSAEIALGVAATYPQVVAAVVLVGGVVPESGKSFMSLLPFPQRLFLYFLLKLSRNGIKLPASLIKSEYCSDLDEGTTKIVLERVTREAPRLYLDNLEWSALPQGMPRFYIKLLNDKSVDPKQQDQIIDRIRATDVKSLDTGHLPMLARPHKVATTLNDLADTVQQLSEHNPNAA